MKTFTSHKLQMQTKFQPLPLIFLQLAEIASFLMLINYQAHMKLISISHKTHYKSYLTVFLQLIKVFDSYTNYLSHKGCTSGSRRQSLKQVTNPKSTKKKCQKPQSSITYFNILQSTRPNFVFSHVYQVFNSQKSPHQYIGKAKLLG